MSSIIKKIDNSKVYLIVVLIIISWNLSTLLNILYYRQFIGFIVLSILPGFLLIKILKLSEMSLLEKFTISVGLSIFFHMFFGLVYNYLLVTIGYEKPLSLIPLLIFLNFAFVTLITISYILRDKETDKETYINFSNYLTNSEKIYLIPAILFPALSVVGMNILNTQNHNNILILFILFLFAYLLFFCSSEKKISPNLYPIVIYLTSISLLLMMSLRSNYILGSDIHLEYYLFENTLSALQWNIGKNITLDACLSISLLPAIYQSILGIKPMMLYKLIYSIIYSVSPLIIYVISKKYIGNFYSFLAALFFMFQLSFIITATSPRTSMAILFFALSMMIFFNDEIDMVKRKILFITFIISCTISHYSTTYIFFLIIFSTFIAMLIISIKYPLQNKLISMSTIFLFAVIIFLWYSQVTGAAFDSGIRFFQQTIESFNQMFVHEIGSKSEVPALLGDKIIEKNIPSQIHFLFTWLVILFQGIGIIALIKNRLKIKTKKSFKFKVEDEYLIVAFICSTLLFLIIAVPYISKGYSLDRIYTVSSVILSVIFIIGGISISRFLKIPTYITILFILLTYFACVSGFMYNIFGDHRNVLFNSDGSGYDDMFVHDQDSYSAKWLGDKGAKKLIYSDHQGMYRLISQGHTRNIDEFSLLRKTNLSQGYIYLRYTNSVKEILKFDGGSMNISQISTVVNVANKIYDNDAQIYELQEI